MDQELIRIKNAFLYPLYMVVVLWFFYFLDHTLGLNFRPLSLYPRKVDGLPGVLFTPLLHGDMKHLWNNTVPLYVLSAMLIYFYSKLSGLIMILGLILSGLLTWLIARPVFHIGASGIVYMLATFLFVKGILSKNFRLIAVSMLVAFLYGALVWGLLPIKQGVSWEGHLSGAIVGLILALFFRTTVEKRPKFPWEEHEFNPLADPFMRQFDENGNFFEFPDEEE